MSPLRPGAAAILLLALTGCHLVDQRDFNPKAGRKPQPPPGPVMKFSGPAPLITITYNTPDPNYAAELAVAVKQALALKQNVLFTVQVLVPLAATPEAQAVALRQATASGREIGEAIVADGADQGQIELAVRGDPGVHLQQVQVFVH
jgi:hypothetical protein